MEGGGVRSQGRMGRRVTGASPHITETRVLFMGLQVGTAPHLADDYVGDDDPG